MKEYLKDIDPVVYDQVVYTQLVLGWMVGQFSLDGDVLIYPSPEKNAPAEEICEPVKPHTKHPLQGEFILTKPNIRDQIYDKILRRNNGS